MKYRNVEIGQPSLEMVEEFCRKANLAVPAQDVYNHYQARDWKTKKGDPIVSVEGMCNAANSVFVMKGRKNGVIPQKGESMNFPSGQDTLKALREYINNNSAAFIKTMEIIRIQAPALWAILYNAASLHLENRL